MDHQRISIHSSNLSCGILELSGWATDDCNGLLYQLAFRLYHPSRGSPAACFVWSTTVDDTYLSRLLGQVGTVEASPEAENPKTGNLIVVYTCAINHEFFKNWYAEQRVARAAKVGAGG